MMMVMMNEISGNNNAKCNPIHATRISNGHTVPPENPQMVKPQFGLVPASLATAYELSFKKIMGTPDQAVTIQVP